MTTWSSKSGLGQAARSASRVSCWASGINPRASGSSTSASGAGRSGSHSTSIAPSISRCATLEGNPLTGWRAWTGIGMAAGGGRPAEATLEVFDTIEELREHVPAEFCGGGLRLCQASERRRHRHLTRSRPRGCGHDCSHPRHPGLRPPQVIWRAARPGRDRPRGPRRDGVCAARAERRRQDDHHPHPHHPADARRRRGRRWRPRSERSGGHPGRRSA